MPIQGDTAHDLAGNLHIWIDQRGWVSVETWKNEQNDLIRQQTEEYLNTPPPEAKDETVTPEWKQCLLIGEGLANDTGTTKECCPKCNGGANAEKAFSISRDSAGYIYWRCFRASCGYKGSTGGGSKGKRSSSREVREFTLPVVELTDDQKDYFTDEFGIELFDKVSYCPSKDAYAFKAIASSGGLIGWQLRWFDGRSQKADTYPTAKNLPFMGVYEASSVRGVIVVEDPVSAIKVAQTGFTSACLFGTTFDWERAYILREISSSIHLALDRGTVPLMIQYKSKFESIFDNVVIWTLDEDLKYVTKDRIVQAVVDGHNNFLVKDKEKSGKDEELAKIKLHYQKAKYKLG